MENGFQEPASAIAYNALKQTEKYLFWDNKKKDTKSLFYIFQGDHASISPRIAVATKSKQALDMLETSYEGKAKVKTTRLQMLRRYFWAICIKESKNVESFFHTCNWTSYSNQVSWWDTWGKENSWEIFPRRFGTIFVAIEETKDLSHVFSGWASCITDLSWT